MDDVALREFDINAANPFALHKQISIKASAGTGKTYSLTTTVARLVAEHGVRADQILLMTFTNEATGELRLETRRRCQEALAALKGSGKHSPWMAHMGPDAVVRLDEFLARYDEVTISTIHGFCQTVLRQAGLDGLAPTNFKVVANVDDIIDQTITDLLAHELSSIPKRLIRPTPAKPVTMAGSASSLSKLRDVVKTLLNNDGAVLLPAPSSGPLATQNSNKKKADVNEIAQNVADDARRIVDEVRRRCESSGIITYNDMIRLVADALDTTQKTGESLAEQLASQYSVVMVDEFQDTDAIQWRIFRTMFEASKGTMTLLTVGDPKQAIYRFRGADVNVYLAALDGADDEDVYDLGTNRRSDAPLLRAIGTLLSRETFDSDGKIGFSNVAADPRRSDYGLELRPDADTDCGLPGAPLEIRYWPRSTECGAKADGKGNNAADEVRFRFFGDVATRVVDILNNALIPDRELDDGTKRPVRPGDVAVLVNTHSHADRVVGALQSIGLAAVQMKTGSVFQSEAARHWMMLLRALANPGRPRHVRTHALSWFGGASEEDLVADDVELLIELQRKCAVRAEVLKKDGITALYLLYRSDPSFLETVLSDPDGLRNLTDLDHIAEILGSMPQFATSAGPLECLDALEDLIDLADEELDEQKRRIDTDRDSVKVMTIHASKGLQFPIVLLPTLNHVGKKRGPDMFPAQLFDGEDRVRVIDAGSTSIGASAWEFDPDPTKATGADIVSMKKYESKSGGKLIRECRQYMDRADREAEQRRLFYVAMTRAMHKLICYWSPVDTGEPKDPFIRAIMHATGEPAVPIEASDLNRTLGTLVTSSGGTIEAIDLSSVKRTVTLLDRDETSTAGEVPDTEAPVVAVFDRGTSPVVVHGYGRWSYSSVTKKLKGQSTFKTPAAMPGVSDETNTDDDGVPAGFMGFAWHGLPAGSGFGNGVHHVLDVIDPAAADLTAELSAAVDETFMSWGDDLDRTRLVNALRANLSVPLGSAFEGSTLASLGRQNRLSEMAFDFPLPDTKGIPVAKILSLLSTHGNLNPGALAHFERLTGSVHASKVIAGFMNGSIDAVFRIPGPAPRFVVCDYKTNRLHSENDPTPAWSYEPAALEEAMLRDGYFIQAAIYSVALHRYLRQRLGGYDYDVHFGGVSYLFLRGLLDTPSADGSQRGHYFWRPERVLIESLDSLFAKGPQ